MMIGLMMKIPMRTIGKNKTYRTKIKGLTNVSPFVIIKVQAKEKTKKLVKQKWKQGKC